MTLQFQYQLSADTAFRQRVQAAATQAYVAITTETVNEVQSIIDTGATAGTFTLTYNGQTTTAIAFNGTANVVQLALAALSNIGTGNVVCTGGPLPGTAIAITFAGTLGSNPENLITVASQPTGGNVVVTRTTTGVSFVNHAARAALAKAGLNGTGPSLDQLSLAVAGNATVQADFNVNLTPSVTETVLTNDMQFAMNGVIGSFA